MSDRSDYFERAESWATDTRVQAARSVRTAWTIAGIAVGIAALEAVALSMLTPLKTVQPVTLLVDRQTGFVQALDPLTPKRVAADDALTNSFLAQYVTAREGFDRATVSADYRKVALWSADVARRSYLAQMPASNPDSPFQRYPSGALVDARVKSVSRLSPGIALVRFDTALQTRNGGGQPPQPWIAVVRFRYSDAPMRFEDRLVNPLGFQVTSYRRDAEAPPPPASPTGPYASSAYEAVPTSTVVVGMRAPVSVAPLRAYDQRQPSRSFAPPRQGPLPRYGVLQPREVPLANLPQGSPLSDGAVDRLAQR